MRPALAMAGRRCPADPSIRGYHAVYRQQELNRCPGCGRSHWYIGRRSAECGFCATALPFASAEIASQGCLDWS